MVRAEPFAGLYAELGVAGLTEGQQRIPLLKKIESIVRTTFEKHKEFEVDRLVLGMGADAQERVLKAVLDQGWVGVAEYSDDWFKVMAASSHKQKVQRAFVRLALNGTSHGFDGLDRSLIYYSSLVSDAYDDWFRAWAKTVQGNDLARQLAADEKAGTLPKELFNHYTIITTGSGGTKYDQVAYASYFPAEMAVILTIFDAWLADLDKAAAMDVGAKAQYQAYLQQYRACLAEKEVAKLDPMWEELDKLWVVIKYHIQIVHDMEYGYGDPLRCKVAPDFSCRLTDETYQESNANIGKIQATMVDYFKGRPGPICAGGMNALKETMAVICYLPFQCGISLYFRASGQAIPNRSEIRDKYGAKIYFDPVSTGARLLDVHLLARAVLADKSCASVLDTLGTIVWHVASHEIGHCIYGLDVVADKIKVSTKTLLEEPRAELTTLHTLPLLLAAGLLSQEKLCAETASMLLSDMRRYSMFDSSATRPYTISAMANWSRAAQHGYLSLDSSGKVVLDDSKVMAFLKESSHVFESILDAEDRGDGAAIEQIMQGLQQAEQQPIVQHMIKQLFIDKVQLTAAAAG